MLNEIAQEKWILHNFDIKEELPNIKVEIKHWSEMVDKKKEDSKETIFKSSFSL